MSITRTTRVPILLAALALITACGDDAPPDETSTVLEGGAFGTFYQITLPGEWPEQELETLQAGIRGVLDEVDAGMSTYREDSDLNRLNRAPVGEWVSLPEPVVNVLAISQDVAAQTQGAFDVTVGALVNLWGFGPEGRPDRRPDTGQLEAALAETGITGLQVDSAGQRARRQGDFLVDLSGIAKGYGVDAVGRYLEHQGIDNYLVNIGGDLLAGGRYSTQRTWRIGVEQPHDRDADDMPLIVPLENMAAATSGDYRNYFEEGGQRFSHILDPRTGEPVSHRLASVTVLHASSTWADAYATGLLVLGTEQALRVATEQDLKVTLISRRGDGFRTDNSPAMVSYLERTR